MKRYIRANGKREHVYAITSGIFGVVYALGCSVWENSAIGFSLFGLIWGTAAAWVFLHGITFLTEVLPEGRGMGDGQTAGRIWLRSFILMVISYLMCLLAYFPGACMNDELHMFRIGLGLSFVHPPVYCAVIVILREIGRLFGSYQLSFALYSILQILAVSSISAGLIVWFWKRNVHRWIKYAVLFYYVCSPLLAMYAISMLKDTMFSLILFAVSVMVYDMLEDQRNRKPGRWFSILFCAAAFSAVVLRHNGVYIILPILVILFFVCRQHRRMLVCAVLCVLLGIAANVLPVAYFVDGHRFAETVGVPLQQLCATVANDGELTEEQEEFLSHLMPLDEIKEQYNPNTADTIKWSDDFDSDFLDAHKAEFMQIWAQALPANFRTYVLAYLQDTYWFWAPRQEGGVQYIDSVDKAMSSETLRQWAAGTDLHDAPVFPEPLSGYMRDYFGHASVYLREGVCFWLLVFCAVIFVVKRRQIKYLLLYAPAFLLWFTIMLSTPINASFRYVLIYAYGLPFYFGLLFETPQEKAE